MNPLRRNPGYSVSDKMPDLRSSTELLETLRSSGTMPHQDNLIYRLRKEPERIRTLTDSPRMLRRLTAHRSEDFLRSKFNSTASLFINTTIKKPSYDEILKCLSRAIYCNVMKNKYVDNMEPKAFVFNEIATTTKFSSIEKSLRQDKPVGPSRESPVEQVIYDYLQYIFTNENLTSECAVMALAYMDQITTKTGVLITPKTWRKLCLGCIIVASKVLEDQAIWNSDYLRSVPLLSVKELNNLEREVLKLLQFNVSLKASSYAKYYFELRSLSKQDSGNFPLKPLDNQGIKRLDVAEIQEECKVKARRRSHSR